jgi:hypothetical protein
MSNREEIASKVYEKFKAHVYYLEEFVVEDSITDSILQTYLEDYDSCDFQSTPPLALKQQCQHH